MRCTVQYPPPKPATRLAGDVAGGRVLLAWEAEGDARYFWVLRRRAPAADFVRVAATICVEHVDVPPMPGMYEYRILACNECGQSPMVETLSVAFFPDPDSAPTASGPQQACEGGGVTPPLPSRLFPG